MTKYRIAIIGYGNIGKFAVEAINNSPDLELAGVVRRSSSIGKGNPPELQDIPVVTDISELKDVQAALLSTPTRVMEGYAQNLLEKGINTIDSFDIHEDIFALRKSLMEKAKIGNAVAVISAGWDPGTDSMIRGIMELIAPAGITYTNFGPGMSMGHSVAVKAIEGVEDALAVTIPLGTGIHRRMVYIQSKKGYNFNKIKENVLSDPYFIKDETHVFNVPNVKKLIDKGHGVVIERKGAAGVTHNQLLNFEMRISNPAVTAQIMVASARASFKQKPGAYTLIEIPIIDYLYGDKEKLIKKLV